MHPLNEAAAKPHCCLNNFVLYAIGQARFDTAWLVEGIKQRMAPMEVPDLGP